MRNNRVIGNKIKHHTFDFGEGIRKDLFPKLFKMWWFMAILMGIMIFFVLLSLFLGLIRIKLQDLRPHPLRTLPLPRPLFQRMTLLPPAQALQLQ